jgi:spore maturation protein CgeB
VGYSFVVLTGKGSAVPGVSAGIAGALEALGHRVSVLDADACAKQGPRVFVDAVAKAAPACVLGYGALPIIETDRAESYFERLRIPYVSLFYDNPFFYRHLFSDARYAELRASRYFCATASDKVYVDALKAAGIARVHRLPLASDARFFDAVREERYDAACVFVGSLSQSPDALRAVRAETFSASAAVNRCIDRAVASPSVYHACEEMFADMPVVSRAQVFRWAAEEASLRARVATVAALAPLGVDVYGNDAWCTVLGSGCRFRGTIDYERDLPNLYATAAVHLNVTHPQLVGAVNQRVFDVSAAGGFVLCDERDDLREFFGQAAVAYRDASDAADKAAVFVKADRERRERALAMQKTVRDAHTWQHRAQELIVFLRELRMI